CSTIYFVFFFQAEDGIRDYKVTGVQTCALPIFIHFGGGHCVCDGLCFPRPLGYRSGISGRGAAAGLYQFYPKQKDQENSENHRRSEERRVGKECRSSVCMNRKTATTTDDM